MNYQDTAAVIAYLGSAYPNFDPSDDTLDVWCAELEDQDPTCAAEAMRAIVRTSEFPPTIARFRMECQRVALARCQLQRPALPPGARDPWPTELIEQLHAVCIDAVGVAGKGGREHWHGGPDPCPVCGGMQTKTKAVLSGPRAYTPREQKGRKRR